MRDSPRSEVKNLLLGTLSSGDLARLAPNLKRVELNAGQFLADPGDCINCLYFPESAVISTVYIAKNGSMMEVALTGNKGVFGVAAILGVNRMPYHAVVEVPGTAMTLGINTVKDNPSEYPVLREAMLRYVYALLVQTSQLAVCNGSHSVEHRLSRWLLLVHDRSGRAEFRLTHDDISTILGTHRSAVSIAAKALQCAGAISYQRGLIRVTDFQRLERSTCECFALIKREFDRIFVA